MSVAAAVVQEPCHCASARGDRGRVRAHGAGAGRRVARHGDPRLSEARATRIFLRDEKVADWLARYPSDPATDALYEPDERRGRSGCGRARRARSPRVRWTTAVAW